MEEIEAKRVEIAKAFNLTKEDAAFYVYTDRLSNNAYNQGKQNINLLMKNGTTMDVSAASDNLNISAFSTPVEKWFLCYPEVK